MRINTKKTVYTLFFLLLFSFLAKSQTEYPYYKTNYHIIPSDSGKLFLEIDNVNFIKNNEYFGGIAEGYTLLGFDLSPTFVYIPSSKIKWSAGVHLLSYYGRENDVEANLLLSIQYKVSPNFDFVLGNIYGTVNHQLIEPLFDLERFLNNNVENGVQFLWNSDRIQADLWLDWEQQIFQDDPFQEKFNVGLSSNFILFEKENSYRVSVPFQTLIRHEGGQINSDKTKPLTTIFNNASGLSISKPIHHRYLHLVCFSSYWVNYQDLSPTKKQMYIDGMATYSTLELKNTTFDFLLGYWYGKQFIAPLGSPIFETYSRTKFYIEEPIRQIVTGKLTYHKNIFTGINLGFRFETYFDVQNLNTEYTWSITAIFNEKFFLK